MFACTVIVHVSYLLVVIVIVKNSGALSTEMKPILRYIVSVNYGNN